MENMTLRISNQAGVFQIRPITAQDSSVIRDIILETLIEHGAVGGGFASGDQDTRQMFEAFQKEGRKYFVVVREGSEGGGSDVEGSEALAYGSPGEACEIIGGAGIAPLPGEPDTCELVKMYFRPGARGLGLGKRLLQLCMEEAVKFGYSRIYLETIEQMHAARGLYEHLGFLQIPGPMGTTGHYSCNVFYLRKLVLP